MCLCAIIQDEYLRLDSAFAMPFQNVIHFITFCMLSIFSCKYRSTVFPLRFTHNDYRLPNPDPGLETSKIFLTISSNLQQIHNTGSNRARQGTLHCPCNCKGECWCLQHQLSNSQGNTQHLHCSISQAPAFLALPLLSICSICRQVQTSCLSVSPRFIHFTTGISIQDCKHPHSSLSLHRIVL